MRVVEGGDRIVFIRFGIVEIIGYLVKSRILFFCILIYVFLEGVIIFDFSKIV